MFGSSFRSGNVNLWARWWRLKSWSRKWNIGKEGLLNVVSMIIRTKLLIVRLGRTSVSINHGLLRRMFRCPKVGLMLRTVQVIIIRVELTKIKGTKSMMIWRCRIYLNIRTRSYLVWVLVKLTKWNRRNLKKK